MRQWSSWQALEVLVCASSCLLPPPCLLGMGSMPSTVPDTPYPCPASPSRKDVTLSLGRRLGCVSWERPLFAVALLPTQRPWMGCGGSRLTLGWQLHLHPEGGQAETRYGWEKAASPPLIQCILSTEDASVHAQGFKDPGYCLFTMVGAAGLWEEEVPGSTFPDHHHPSPASGCNISV